MVKENILTLFHGEIRAVLLEQMECVENLQEIRLRAGGPLILIADGEEQVIDADVRMGHIKEILEIACGYSGYAFEEEISRGYITLPGGHRIGMAGRAVVTGKGIQTLKYISALNVRIAHPVKGCALRWESYLYQENAPCHILIISPPGCGKTTLLRDVIRIFSDGTSTLPGVTVGVVDERSEIAGTYRGIPAYDLGIRTDVLDGCPKVLGMEMMLRSMAPKVLAVDEIGTRDVTAIENALHCGCKVLATLHGKCIEDYMEKPGFTSLVKEKVFERYIFLKSGCKPGQVSAIYDKNLKILWEEEVKCI